MTGGSGGGGGAIKLRFVSGQRLRVGRRVIGVETWDALRSRRNVREFSSTPVSEEDLAKVLEAGRLAPSAKNWQPWALVVVTDRDQLRELTGVWQGAGTLAALPPRSRSSRPIRRMIVGPACCSTTSVTRPC